MKQNRADGRLFKIKQVRLPRNNIYNSFARAAITPNTKYYKKYILLSIPHKYP